MSHPDNDPDAAGFLKQGSATLSPEGVNAEAVSSTKATWLQRLARVPLAISAAFERFLEW